MSLESKTLYIQSVLDQNLRLILDERWNSKNTNHRQNIRNFLGTEFSSHFSREQLAKLNNLNWLPEASDGFLSISHCSLFGGFVFSKHQVGFDIEERKRISPQLLNRVCSATEIQECPHTEFLWVAKEAGFKALSQMAPTANHPSPDTLKHQKLLISDLTCFEWQSYFENQIFGFRLKSKKPLEFSLNTGFIFTEGPCLFGFYFK